MVIISDIEICPVTLHPGNVGSQGEKVSDEGAENRLLVTAWQSKETSTVNISEIGKLVQIKLDHLLS